MSESSIFLGLSATAAIFKLADFLAEFLVDLDEKPTVSGFSGLLVY